MFEGTHAGGLLRRAGIDFRERMAGPVAFGCSDALVAAEIGDARSEEMTLRLRVEIDDLDAFLGDRQHRTRVSGSVDCDILGGVLPIERGSLALLPETGTGQATTMEYRLDFADRTGRELTLVGVKTVRNDPGPDLWRDTTTLDVQLFPRQHDLRPDGLGMPVLSGQLRLSPLSFLRQLTTFHATAPGPFGRVRTVLAFGSFLRHRLAQVYLGPHDGYTVPEFTGWPDKEHPEGAYVFAHNERIIPAPPEQVWDLIVDAQGWSEFYANAQFVHLSDPQQHGLKRGSIFRWVTFGIPLTSEVSPCEPPSLLGWRFWRTGAYGYHVWLLEPHEFGTRVVTEETQLGVMPWLGRTIMRRALPLGHGYWLRQMARRATRPPRLAEVKGLSDTPGVCTSL
jgi:Polyketide cyclase / dehydrase and lipid transport